MEKIEISEAARLLLTHLDTSESFYKADTLLHLSMEVLIGIQGPGYVLLASNLNQVRGITIMKPDDDKSRQLNNHNLLYELIPPSPLTA